MIIIFQDGKWALFSDPTRGFGAIHKLCWNLILLPSLIPKFGSLVSWVLKARFCRLIQSPFGILATSGVVFSVSCLFKWNDNVARLPLGRKTALTLVSTNLKMTIPSKIIKNNVTARVPLWHLRKSLEASWLDNNDWPNCFLLFVSAISFHYLCSNCEVL